MISLRTRFQHASRLAMIALCACLAGGLSAQEQSDQDAKLRELEQRLSEQQARLEALEAKQPESGATPASTDKPLAGYNRGFFMRSADDKFELRITGLIQARYEYRSIPNSTTPDASSFRMRRVRLYFDGHALTKQLTYRIVSEHATTSNLRAAYIEYAFDPALRLRAGQFPIPFQWHRDVSSSAQHFAERSESGQEFSANGGEDIGVMLHGRLLENRFKYFAGVFGGGGRNISTTGNTGHLLSARVAYAVLGDLPREEGDLADSQSLQWAIGAGVQGAWKNDRIAWDLGRSAANEGRGDFATGTVDTRLAIHGVSLTGEGYYRSVSPAAADVATYDGWAYMVSAGWFVVAKQVELVARFAEYQLDSDDTTTRREATSVGVNLYHFERNLMTKINYVSDRFGGQRRNTILVELQLRF